jgi:hypothetical protein
MLNLKNFVKIREFYTHPLFPPLERGIKGGVSNIIKNIYQFILYSLLASYSLFIVISNSLSILTKGHALQGKRPYHATTG